MLFNMNGIWHPVPSPLSQEELLRFSGMAVTSGLTVCQNERMENLRAKVDMVIGKHPLLDIGVISGELKVFKLTNPGREHDYTPDEEEAFQNNAEGLLDKMLELTQ